MRSAPPRPLHSQSRKPVCAGDLVLIVCPSHSRASRPTVSAELNTCLIHSLCPSGGRKTCSGDRTLVEPQAWCGCILAGPQASGRPVPGASSVVRAPGSVPPSANPLTLLACLPAPLGSCEATGTKTTSKKIMVRKGQAKMTTLTLILPECFSTTYQPCS